MKGELKTLQERAEYFGLDKTKDFEDFREKYLQAVDKTAESGIIEKQRSKTVEMVAFDVHSIGKIDVEKYKCVTKDITTDEVIITSKQIEHIKERHPNDYERFSKYFKEIVEKPLITL